MQYLRAVRIAAIQPEDDPNDQETVEMWKKFKIQWEEHICCVNLNGNNLEFNMNFWRMHWPLKMSSLHLNGNPIQMSGWAKVFFSLTKWIKMEKTPPSDDDDDDDDDDGKKRTWKLRFLEISTDLVFCDSTQNQNFRFPVADDFVVEESGLDYERAVEIMFQIVQFAAIDRNLFKTSVKDLVRCFLSNQVFEQSRVLDQHMFFTCIRDIFWQM